MSRKSPSEIDLEDIYFDLFASRDTFVSVMKGYISEIVKGLHSGTYKVCDACNANGTLVLTITEDNSDYDMKVCSRCDGFGFVESGSSET